MLGLGVVHLALYLVVVIFVVCLILVLVVCLNVLGAVLAVLILICLVLILILVLVSLVIHFEYSLFRREYCTPFLQFQCCEHEIYIISISRHSENMRQHFDLTINAIICII